MDKCFLLVLTVLVCGISVAAPVKLAWTPPADTTGIDGYRVRCGVTGEVLSFAQDFPGASTTEGEVDLIAGQWYCTIQSYADSGTTSAYSATLSFAVHEPPPVVLPFTPLGTPSEIRLIYGVD